MQFLINNLVVLYVGFCQHENVNKMSVKAWKYKKCRLKLDSQNDSPHLVTIWGKSISTGFP